MTSSLYQKLAAIQPTEQQWDNAAFSGWDDHRLRHFLNWMQHYVPPEKRELIEREMHTWWRESNKWPSTGRWSQRAACARRHAHPNDDDPNLYQTQSLYDTKLTED